MPAAHRHLEGALCDRLPLDVLEIRLVDGLLHRVRKRALFHRRQRRNARQKFHRFGKRRDGVDLRLPDIAGFRPIPLWNDEFPVPGLDCGDQHGQDPLHLPHAAVQGKLAEKNKIVERREHRLLGRSEIAERDRQIQRSALFFDVRGREVDHDPRGYEALSAVHARSAHALLGFLDRRIRQPDQFKRRQPLGVIHFYVDGKTLQPVQPVTGNFTQHPFPPREGGAL